MEVPDASLDFFAENNIFERVTGPTQENSGVESGCLVPLELAPYQLVHTTTYVQMELLR